MRDSMVFYRSFYEAVKDLPPEDFKGAVCALMDYGLDEIVPESTGIEKTIYIMAKPQIDKNNKRYENGKCGGRKPSDNQTKPSDNQMVTKCEPNVNVNVNANVNDIKKESEKKKAVAFSPPTQQEVADYVREKGYGNVDVERFIDYYTANGWMVGKNKMKDWKAVVRNWVRSEEATKPNNTKGNKFTNFDQRNYDGNELEKKLLSMSVHDNEKIGGKEHE